MPQSELRKKHKFHIQVSAEDVILSLGILALSCIVCAPLRFIGGSDFHVPLIFVLAVLFISRFTNGYFCGIMVSFLSVFCVNYVFTYPYFAFNFTIAGYPLTFICMLAVSIITSTMTSQIKQQEQIRLEAERERVRANLLRAISHDLRTPLTSIMGSITAVLESGDTLTEDKRNELLSEAKEDAAWLIRMVENLLSATRISDMDTPIHKELEAIEEIIGETVIKFKRQFPAVKVSVAVPDELLLIPLDAMLVEQLIMNLLYNSIIHGEYTSEINITVTNDDTQAYFSVQDDGQGFSEGIIDAVLGGYYLSDSTESRHNIGIGLSVCNTIIKAHGGYMSAHNAAGGGAIVEFTLSLEEK